MENESESEPQPHSWQRWEQQRRRGYEGRYPSPPPPLPSSESWQKNLHRSWTSGWRNTDKYRDEGEYYEHHNSPGPSRARAGPSRDQRMERESRKCWSSNPKVSGIRRSYEEALPNALPNIGRKVTREEKIIQKQNKKYGEVIPKPTLQVL